LACCEKIEKAAQAVVVERAGRHGRAQVVFRKLHEIPPARIDTPMSGVRILFPVPLSRGTTGRFTAEQHQSGTMAVKIR
jgi:hypothetical protein